VGWIYSTKVTSPFFLEDSPLSTVAASINFTYLCGGLIVQPLCFAFGSTLCLVFGFLSLLPPSLSFSLPSSMASTPPTSPQRSQAAGRHAERASCTLGSPEQCRTPAGPSAPSAAAAAPSLPLRVPVTFQGQTYSNLPADLAARPASLPPFPAAPQCRRRSSALSFHAPAPVSLLLFIKFILNIIYILQMLPPPVSIPRPSTLAPPPSITRRHSAMPLLAPAPVSFNPLLLFKH